MADRYWVGGGSSTNWNATANTNWSATSGGANNASVPTTGDTVIFDSNSGSGTSVANASVSLAKMDAQGFAGTLTHNTSVTITITGAAVDSLRLPLSGNYGPGGITALFTCTSTSGTTDITSNGKRFGALTTNGAGGTFRLLDALRVDAFSTSILTHTAGTFNANNFAVTATLFASSNSNTRVLTMGSGLWTLGTTATAGATVWNMATTTGLTFNKDTANIVIASNGLASQRIFAGGNLTYNDLTLAENSGKGSIHFTGSNRFAHLYAGAGQIVEVLSGTTQTVDNPIAFVGTSALPITLQASAVGSSSTLSISSGASTLEWAVIRDMIFAGGQTASATNSLDTGNNTGITISAPVTTSFPTAATIAAAVWDEPTAGNVTAGTFGAQLKTVVDTIDTSVAGVKAKTDSLTFTVAGQVDGNIKSVAGTTVTGVGSEADPWGP